MTVVGQVEIDPFCRRVLAKHWPDVERHDDVRTAVEWWRSAVRPAVHVVAGGPPCQPASRSGRRLGEADPRWGWPWFLDVVRAVGPVHVIVENPPGLLDLDRGRPFGWILGQLADLGFDAQWSVLSACALGAPHARERLFVVANANGVDGQARLGLECQAHALPGVDIPAGTWPDPLNGPMEADGYGVRVADGVSHGLEPARVKALGNAVVPQVAEYVGRLVTGRAS